MKTRIRKMITYTLMAMALTSSINAEVKAAPTTTNASTKTVLKKKRICNIINGTTSNPSYLGAQFDIGTHGRFRLGLFGPTRDIYPVFNRASSIVNTTYTYPVGYSSWEWGYPYWGSAAYYPVTVSSTDLEAVSTAIATGIHDKNIPDATASGIKSSDRVEGQIDYLSNKKEIPDTRGVGARGVMGNTVARVFQ